MNTIKSIIPVVLIFFLIFSAVDPAFADLSVEVYPTTVHVNSTVTITVTASNDGLLDWYPVEIYAPIPDGLEFLSFVIPDKTLQNYDPNTGIWDVNRMRHDERGHLKTLIITAKVLPKAAGKQINAIAKFKKLGIEITGTDITHLQAAAKADTLTVSRIINNNTHTNNTGTNGTGPGNNGIGAGNNGTGNGDNITNLGNSALSTVLGNLTPSKKNNPLANLQSGGGGGNKKANEINITTPSTPNNSLGIYILAVLLIIGLIVIGYFYGIKRER